jgi:hypothetical protein
MKRREPQTRPLIAASSGALEATQVYLHKSGQPGLAAKQKMRLTKGQTTLELEGSHVCGETPPTQDGIYVSESNFENLGGGEASLQTYRWTDTIRKLFHRQALTVILGALLGVVIALTGLFGLLFSPNDAATIATRGQDLVAATAAPVADLRGTSGLPSAVTTAELKTAGALQLADACLNRLAGGIGPATVKLGSELLPCVPEHHGFWSDRWLQQLIALIGGLVLAFLNTIVAVSRYGFRKGG